MKPLCIVLLSTVILGCGWRESEDYLRPDDSDPDNPLDTSDSASEIGSDSSTDNGGEDGSDIDGSVDETCGGDDTGGICGGTDVPSSDPVETDLDTDWDGGASPFESFCGDPRFVIFTQPGGRAFRRDDIPRKGAEDADVAIDGFSNFYCSHCRDASNVFRNIFANTVYNTRTVYYFHHFGWSSDMSQPGWDAHRAAFAAFRQGFFWEMHDAIFAAETAPYQNDLYQMAGEIDGMNTQTFAWDYSSPEAEEYLTRDLEDGQDAGVNGTPTIFVNGFRLSPWTDLQDLLDCLYGL